MSDLDPETQRMRKELEREGVLSLDLARALLARNDDGWRLVKYWRDKYEARFDEEERLRLAAAKPRDLRDFGKEVQGIGLVIASFGPETAPVLLARMGELCREYLAKEGAGG